MSSLRTRLSIPTPAESYDALFGSTPKGNIQKLSIADLQPYPNQPFHPYSVQRLQELSEDIAQNGVLCPIIVRPMPADDEHLYSYFQILAGHNRVAAAEAAGLLEVPAIVKDVGEDEAALIMVTTNLNQRDKLLPSEKAFAYKMQLEAMKKTVGRPAKNNLSQLGTQKRSDQTMAEYAGESRNQIQRYIRLTYLIQPFLELIDNDALPFIVGVYLSYLPQERQELLYSFMEANEIKKISMAQAEVIKQHKDTLDGRKLQLIFYGDPNKAKRKTAPYKLPVEQVEKYFPNLKPSEIEKELSRILDFYFTKGD